MPIKPENAARYPKDWRRISAAVRERAGIDGLNFHDARATFATRASKRVDVLTLARILGHKNLAQLMTYYRESAESIAERI